MTTRQLLLAAVLTLAGCAALPAEASGWTGRGPFGRDPAGDTLRQAARTCGDPSGEAAIVIAACATLIETPALGARERAAAFNERGRALQRQGHLTEAVADWDAAIRVYPRDVAARLNRGSAAREAGRWQQALADYDSALMIDPMNANALNNRCYLRALAGMDLDQALSDCNASLRIRRDDPRVLDSRGFTHLKRGETAEALADFNGALRLDPESAHALYGRALCKQALGRADEARADLKEALTLNPRAGRDYEQAGMKAGR